MNKSFPIFISYKRIDKERVFAIKDSIEKNVGEKCWIDLDGIESDAQFVNVIIKAINNADVFLFMYSHSHTEINDYKKDWTVREISFAQKKNKRIVFVNIDNTPLTDWFEIMFGLQQQVDASSDILMKKLYIDIQNWLGKDSGNSIDQNDTFKELNQDNNPSNTSTTFNYTFLPVLNGPESFIFGDILEVKAINPLKKAVWEIYCGTECLYKSNIIQTNRVIKLYENTEKIRFIMNGHVSKVEKYKTKQLTIRYSHYDNPSICADLSIDEFSSYEKKAHGNIKSSSVDSKVDGMSSNNLSKPILIGPERKSFIYYETILINVQNPVKNAVWEILTDSSCAYKSNSINPAWGKKVFLKEFESNEKIRFKIARDIGDGYSYSADKVLIRYYQSDNPNILAELTLSSLNKY